MTNNKRFDTRINELIIYSIVSAFFVAPPLLLPLCTVGVAYNLMDKWITRTQKPYKDTPLNLVRRSETDQKIVILELLLKQERLEKEIIRNENLKLKEDVKTLVECWKSFEYDGARRIDDRSPRRCLDREVRDILDQTKPRHEWDNRLPPKIPIKVKPEKIHMDALEDKIKWQKKELSLQRRHFERELNRERANYEALIDKQHEKNCALENEVYNLQGREAKFSEKIRSLEAELRDNCCRIQNFERRESEFKARLQKAQAECDNYKKNVQDFEIKVRKLKSIENAKNAQIQFMEAENHELKDDNRHLKSELQRNEKALQRMDLQMISQARVMESLRETVREMAENVENQEVQIRRLLSENEKYRRDLKDVGLQRDHLVRENEQITIQLQMLLRLRLEFEGLLLTCDKRTGNLLDIFHDDEERKKIDYEPPSWLNNLRRG